MSLRLTISISFLLFLFNNGVGQIVMDRQVISCFGSNYSGTINVSSTAGQVETTTYSTETGVLTQGFHQPSNVQSMHLTVAVYKSECKETYDVRILAIDGCDDLSGLQILWNDSQGGMIQKDLPANTTIVINTLSGCQHIAILDLANHPNKIITACEIDFYNYLSPNNDGDNDVWIIENLDNPMIQKVDVKLFNRWGALVWEGLGYDNINVVWKGKAQNGADLPDGTYYYITTINEQQYNGYVELMR